jgi:hypothetical protein
MPSSRYAPQTSCQQKGQGMGPVKQAGRKAYFRVFAGDYASAGPVGR